MSSTSFRVETDPQLLLEHVSSIRSLADMEKEALGFLPEAAYRDAITQRRLFGMFARRADAAVEVAGFILFSGVFPNARVQQVAVASTYRRNGIASTLVNALVSHLESRGYLNLTAAVASDLTGAQAFYERKGFIARRVRDGGAARQRTIVLRSKELDTASLFSLMAPPAAGDELAANLKLRSLGAFEAPLYAIDLNVLFDLIKQRPRSGIANRLFGAALAHRVRLAVAPEFIVELERTSHGQALDSTLQLARQLPRIPFAPKLDVDRVAAIIHKTVFEDTGLSQANSKQAISDARHLAEAALARASGYITSDTHLLNARETLLELVGLDVASLEEFMELLPVEDVKPGRDLLRGTQCEARSAASSEAKAYLVSQAVSESLVELFLPTRSTIRQVRVRAVFEGAEIVGVSLYLAPPTIDAAAKMLVHIRADHVSSETFAEHLLDELIREASNAGPVTIELQRIAGQTAVNQAAKLRGFLPATDPDALIKVALGRPLTPGTWLPLARQMKRRTGLSLPDNLSYEATAVEVQTPDGASLAVKMPALEAALSPTIIAWPRRDGVIVPIAKSFADDLLGTADQYALFGRPSAAFVGLRIYFNSPKTSHLMRPGLPILFYESKRTGGRGAIVAAGLIVDTTVLPKEQVPVELLRRAVVDDLDPLTASSEVLATSFDNLIRFPNLVTFETLRAVGAAGTSNLRTATALPSALLAKILDLGWSSEGCR
ncbi:GNAT family N-acetyltransferase [Bradyrhizobium japonicum]|uniref:GNAT family N-acetyltransferase n=1 Tax=Bradyrhizobium japonicum TaxID=375 RepID=UPI001BA758F7|nr:GNAT family N-acetyltransferase [Bradyrhizobium japonicum]MBR0746435.1 GNAT family N-acetyltransferase [Bradyrhizobium japonicum]